MRQYWNPFEDVESLFDQLSSGTPFHTPMSANIDIHDDDDQLVVTADVPGYSKETLDIRLDQQNLRISATTGVDEEDETETLHQRSSFQQTIRLPSAVTTDDATATYRNGVLSIILPKIELSGTQIPVSDE